MVQSRKEELELRIWIIKAKETYADRQTWLMANSYDPGLTLWYQKHLIARYIASANAIAGVSGKRNLETNSVRVASLLGGGGNENK